METSKSIEYQYVNTSIEGFDRALSDAWITQIVQLEKKQLGVLTFIFCDDDYLLMLNKTYLQHDTLTDVITFDYGEEYSGVSGDIFISKDRVQENAHEMGILFFDELYRVMVHGVLHLLGYSDKDSVELMLMRKKENDYLSLLP